MEEIWKDIPGYEGKYRVSNKGNVKSLNYHREGKEAICKQRKNNGGYFQVILYKNGKAKTCLVHRLVWEAFNGPIPDGMQINHKDENASNNNLDNLMLCTQKENNNWGTRNKKISKSLSKMVEQYDLEGTHICTWFSLRGIEEQLGYNNGNISSCCSGRRNTAYGCVWKYAY